MNEFYAKDCSKKGHSMARLKAESGAGADREHPRTAYRLANMGDRTRHP